MANGFEFGSQNSSGSSGAPVGSLIAITDSINPTYTENNQDYLRTGILAPIGIYSGLEFTNPYLTANVGTQKNVPPLNADIFGANGYYYQFGNEQAPQCANGINGSWAAVVSDVLTTVTDVFPFGSILIHLGGTSNINSISTTTSTPIGTTGSTSVGAVNAAGNLGVAIASFTPSANQIWTSVNGATWTTRSPTGGAALSPTLAIWNVPNSYFIYLTNNGTVFTTSDGFTLTSRGIISGITGSFIAFPSNKAASLYSAYSATSSIFSAKVTYNGVLDYYLFRTTNGVTWTVTSQSSALALDSRQALSNPVQMTYIGGAYVAYVKALSGDTTTVIYKSTDDGLTWEKIAIPYNPGVVANNPCVQIAYVNSTIVTRYQLSTTYGLATHASLSATHVGIAQKSDNVTSGGATISNYVRIR